MVFSFLVPGSTENLDFPNIMIVSKVLRPLPLGQESDFLSILYFGPRWRVLSPTQEVALNFTFSFFSTQFFLF